MSWLIRPILPLLLGCALAWGSGPDEGQPQAPPDSSAPTEQYCSFGLAKGDHSHQSQGQIHAGGVGAGFAGGVFEGDCGGRGHYGFAHSNRTMNCPVQWPESQRVHWPVMRVFQSVPF